MAANPPSISSLLDPVNFKVRFTPLAPRQDTRVVTRLYALVTSVDAATTPSLLMEWVEDCAAWLLDSRDAQTRNKTLTLLLDVLESLDDRRAAMNAALSLALQHTSALRLLSDTGLPTEHGFFAEAANRLSLKLLPEAPDPTDLAQLLFRCFPGEPEAKWVEDIPEELSDRVVRLLPALQSETVSRQVLPDVRQAAQLLAVRVSALGLADDVRSRSPALAIAQSPFLELSHSVEAALAEVPGATVAAGRAREAITACRHTVNAVLANLETSGVSVDLVYRLERITKSLDRLFILLTLISATDDKAAVVRKRFFVNLLRGAALDRSLTQIVSRSSRQLARKVIERAGSTGEHYITRSNAEWHEMISSAGGGGAITAFTAQLKFVIIAAGLPAFFEGFFASLNYVASFLGMQFFGFTLATKQPSMTAAALASNIKERSNEEAPDLEPLLDQIAGIARSQLAAIIGNIGVVVPTGIAIDLVVRLVRGHSVLDAATAHHVVETYDPIHTATILWGALTGVFLWVSSLAAGAFENWAVYRKLPEALTSLRPVRWFLGPQRSKKLNDFLHHNIAGFGGNFTLGVLMGMVSPIGKFFGVPLAAAHVTLSSAQLTFAGMQQGPEAIMQTPFLLALLGIVIIGALNFGVSFVLALLVALQARDLGARSQLRIGRALLQRFLKAPRSFILPPKAGLTDAAVAAEPAAVVNPPENL